VAASSAGFIEGLAFRSNRGEEDEPVHALRAGCVECDQVDLLSTSEGLPSLDEMRGALKELVAAQRQSHRLLVEVDGQVVGRSLVDSWTEDDGRWVGRQPGAL
jgi:hypothetical protein